MNYELNLLNSIIKTGEITSCIEQGVDHVFSEHIDVWNFILEFNKFKTDNMITENNLFFLLFVLFCLKFIETICIYLILYGKGFYKDFYKRPDRSISRIDKIGLNYFY